MEISEIMKTFDGYIALGVALYVINVGKVQNEAIFGELRAMVTQEIEERKALQEKLINLLEKICLGK
jgi:hypothetical protein